MREILFKAKRLDNGEWVQGNVFFADNGKCEICIGTPIVRITYEVDPETVCQYAGLTDKNGVKIFDGDVLCFENQKPFAPWIAKVEWKNCEYYLDGISRISRVFLSDYVSKEIEVIGNIHDKTH